MSQNLQNSAKFQKIQLDNLVDFEKCCKTRIFLQKLVPIQPKTSEILPKNLLEPVCDGGSEVVDPLDGSRLQRYANGAELGAGSEGGRRGEVL